MHFILMSECDFELHLFAYLKASESRKNSDDKKMSSNLAIISFNRIYYPYHVECECAQVKLRLPPVFLVHYHPALEAIFFGDPRGFLGL